MKRKLLWGLVLVLVWMPVLALATSGAKGEDGGPAAAKNLSLKEALEIAMQDNLQVELAALGIEKAQLAWEQAEYAKKNMLKLISNPQRVDQNVALIIDVIPAQAASGKVMAQTAKTYTENSIKFGVEAAYYGVQRAEKMLEVSRDSLKRAEEQLKLAQIKFKAGTVAKFEIINGESQVKSAQAAVNEAESGVKKAHMALNKTLNLPLETTLKLTDQFKFDQAANIDTQQVYQGMTKVDMSYVSAEEGYNMSEANFKYHEKYYTKNTFMYREAEYGLKEAEVNMADVRAQLQLDIKNAYLDLKTAEDNYQVLVKSGEQAKEAYRLTKLRFEVGMATGYDLLGGENSLMQVDMAILNAVYNYNLAKAKFTYGIFGGSFAGGASVGSERTMPAGMPAADMSGEGMPAGM